MSFDRFIAAGWSSVYLSTSAHIAIKLAIVPKKDKRQLEEFIKSECEAYKKLARLQGWIVPRCYGIWRWYGGKALVLSEMGESLDSRGIEFTSLGLVER